jgi:hypothetical protein
LAKASDRQSSHGKIRIYRIGMTIVFTLTAVFGIGQVREFLMHGHLACATAAAQPGWSDDDSSEPASGPEEGSTETGKTKTPPPDIAGDWSGELNDLDLGVDGVTVTIKQKGTKLKGSWNSDFGYGGISGTINSSGILKLYMKDGGGCHLSAVGMLVESNEISATYQVKNCAKDVKGDHGTLDITTD